MTVLFKSLTVCCTNKWSRLTFFYPQLSHPRHSDQYWHFARDIHFIFLCETIVPNLVINICEKLLPEPAQQSLGIGYLKREQEFGILIVEVTKWKPSLSYSAFLKPNLRDTAWSLKVFVEIKGWTLKYFEEGRHWGLIFITNWEVYSLTKRTS